MGRRTTALLIVCAVAAGVLLFAAARRGEPPGRRRVARRVVGLTAASVRAIKVRSGPRLLAARRVAGGWQVLRPAHGDREAARAVEELVEAVTRTVVIDSIPRRIHPEPADFGLDRPRARIELVGKGRREEIVIGDLTPAANSVYAGIGPRRRRRFVRVSLLLGSEVERAFRRVQAEKRS